MRKTIITLLTVLLLMPCTAIALADTQLVLLVYMTGSDLESQGQAASRDLEEMAASLPTDGSLRIIILASGATQWQADVTTDETAMYEVTTDGLQKMSDAPLVSMGNEDTLSTFLTQSFERFPADDYALILWNHGAGPLLGLCYDELFVDENGMDHLTLDELDTALASSPFAGRKLRFIGFDACLMATAEVAQAISPYAHYMIASQETEPASGWDYSFLSRIATSDSGEAWGRQIIDTYATANADSLRPITLSLIDLHKMDQVVKELSLLFDQLAQHLTPDSYLQIAQCRNDTKTLGCSSLTAYDLVDLVDFLTMLKDVYTTEVDPLLHIIEQAIVYNYASEPYINGISLFSPFDNKLRYLSPWSAQYDKLSFAEGYQHYVRQMADIWLGDALLEWQKGNISMNDHQLLSMPLTDAQVSMLAESSYQVLEKIGPNEYTFLYQGNNVELHGQTLYATYYGQALYLTDSDGKAIAGPCSYRVLDNSIAIGVILEDAAMNTLSAYLQYQMLSEEQLAYMGILTYHEGIGMYVPSSLELKDFCSLTLVSWGRTPPEEDLPFEAWPYGEYVLIETLDLDGQPPRPTFLTLPATEERYAMILTQDLQGNLHSEDLLPLQTEGIMPLSIPQQTIETASYRITLVEVNLCSGVEPGLRCVFQYECEAEPQPPQSVFANQTLLPLRSLQMDTVNQDGQWTQTLNIPASILQYLPDQQLSTLVIAFPNSTATFQLSLHMGLFVSDTPAESLASYSANGLDIQLLDLSQTDVGNFIGHVRVVNNTNTPCSLLLRKAALNENALKGTLAANHTELSLPPGCNTICQFHLYAHETNLADIFSQTGTDQFSFLLDGSSEEVLMEFTHKE